MKSSKLPINSFRFSSFSSFVSYRSTADSSHTLILSWVIDIFSLSDCSTVRPKSFYTCMMALVLEAMKNSMMSRLPDIAATCMGVSPLKSRLISSSINTVFYNIAFKLVTELCFAAMWKMVSYLKFLNEKYCLQED